MSTRLRFRAPVAAIVLVYASAVGAQQSTGRTVSIWGSTDSGSNNCLDGQHFSSFASNLSISAACNFTPSGLINNSGSGVAYAASGGLTTHNIAEVTGSSGLISQVQSYSAIYDIIRFAQTTPVSYVDFYATVHGNFSGVGLGDTAGFTWAMFFPDRPDESCNFIVNPNAATQYGSGSAGYSFTATDRNLAFNDPLYSGESQSVADQFAVRCQVDPGTGNLNYALSTLASAFTFAGPHPRGMHDVKADFGNTSVVERVQFFDVNGNDITSGVNYSSDLGIDYGNSAEEPDLTVSPEPSSLALTLTAFSCLVAFGRFGRKRESTSES